MSTIDEPTVETTPGPATGEVTGEDGGARDAATLDEHDGADSPRRVVNPATKGAQWARLWGYTILPALTLLLGAAAGYLSYQSVSEQAADRGREQSVLAAKDTAIAMLSYTPDTAEATLGAARDRLTGSFKDSYTSLTRDVVIPGAKQRNISATATVSAAASQSVTDGHASVLVFVNQEIVIGNDAPSTTTSAVEVTLDKIDNRWLVSGFDPK